MNFDLKNEHEIRNFCIVIEKAVIRKYNAFRG